MPEESKTSGLPHEEAMVDTGEAEPQSGTNNANEHAAEPGEASSDPLGAAQAEAARLKDAWLRTAADFDNYRKRARRDLEDARRGGREDLLRAVLPVFDNLERAIQSALRSADVKGVADGLSMVQRQFIEALGREGIARVPTVGHSFDPGLHEAIQQVETEDHEPGTVIAEVQPGYTQGDRLIRAAMVVVAKAKTNNSGGAQNSDERSS